MNDPQIYAELVAQAEKAVDAVKDPDLKRIAFQKILDDLLSQGGTNKSVKPRARKTRTRQGAEKPKARAKSGPKAYVTELIEEGFFEKPKTMAQVKAELENLGHHIPITSLSGPLQTLCKERTLRRQKVKASGNKETFAYSEW